MGDYYNSDSESKDEKYIFEETSFSDIVYSNSPPPPPPPTPRFMFEDEEIEHIEPEIDKTIDKRKKKKEKEENGIIETTLFGVLGIVSGVFIYLRNLKLT